MVQTVQANIIAADENNNKTETKQKKTKPCGEERCCPAGSLQGKTVPIRKDDDTPISVGGTNTKGKPIVDHVTNVAQCNIKTEELTAEKGLAETVSGIANVIIGVVGFVAVIVIIFGAIRFTTSTGDPDKVKTARKTIIYGVIGLVVAILAFSIVNFILRNVADTGEEETSLILNTIFA